MAARTILDFSDLKEAVRENLGLQSTDTINMNKIERYLNTIYLQYVIPYERWTWLQGDTVVKHSAPYENGTVSVTPESTTVTLSVAPGASDGNAGSFLNYNFSVDGFDEIYKISAHTALSTTITLNTEFLGSLNTEASFKIWKDTIDLPTNAYETVDVWHDRYRNKMEGVGRQELERISGRQGRKVEAFPKYYSTVDYFDPTPSDAETESDRYRQVKLYPSITTEDLTVHVMYSKEATALELDADEPILPIEYRYVLALGATWLGYQHIIRDTQEAVFYRQEFENYLARMAGKTSDSNDTPTIRPKTNYLSARRRGRIGGFKYEAGAFGGSSSASPPTYAKDITLEGGKITANFTVDSGITIDGRDISADGTTLDSIGAVTANIDTPNRAVITDASSNLEESAVTKTELEYLSGVSSSVSGNDDTATLTNKTTTDLVLNGDLSGTAILDEDNMASDSATKVPTQQSVKAYVDAQITAEDLDVTSDSGTIAIDLDSETLDIAGGTGIDTSAATNTVTVAIDSTVTTNSGSQTLTNKTLTSPVINTGVSGTAILDEDNMASDSSTQLATQQSIKAYADTKVAASSGTATDLTLNTSVSGTAVLDEDNMVSDSATKLATQQSIKAYADTKLAADSGSITTYAELDNQAELRFKEQSGNGSNYVALEAPDSIASNVTWKLPDSDGASGQALVTDASGNLSWSNAGGSGTDTNYYSYYDADTANSASVAFYDDGASTEPVDGQSGSPTTVSRALETSSPIYGDNSLKLSKSAADGQGEGWSFPNGIALDDAATSGRTQTVQFTYKTSANYADGDVTVWVYRVGSNTLEALNGFDGLGNYSNELKACSSGVATYTSSFNYSSSDTGVRVLLHISTTNATAYDITVDHIFIGEKAVLQAPIVSEWEEYSYSLTGVTTDPTKGTTTLDKAEYKRVGDSIYIRYNYIQTVAGSNGSGTYLISLPSGLTIDTTNMRSGSSNANTHIGNGSFYNGSTQFDVLVEPDSTTNISAKLSSAGADLSAWGSSNGGLGNTTVEMYFTTGPIPISEWSGNSTNILNSTQQDFQNVVVELSSDDADAVPASITKFTFNNTVEDTLGTMSAGTFTAPSSGTYEISGRFLTDSETWALDDNVVWTAYIDSVADKKIGQWRAGSAATMRAYGELSGTWDLTKGQTIEVYNQSAVATNLINDATHNFLLIKKVSQPTVIGNAGVPVEYVEDITADATYSITADQYGDFASISLTPGTWDIKAQFLTRATGAVTASRIQMGISTTSGNSSTGLTEGDNFMRTFPPGASGEYSALSVYQDNVTVTSTTTYYMKTLINTSITNISASGKISAKRVK